MADEQKQPEPEKCPDCGSTDKKDKKHGCHHFWHDLLDGLGNAIGEAMDQR